MTSPWCRTTISCASAMTARITCSISRMVRPSRRLISLNTAIIWSHSVGRRPAITSSRSSSRGRVASALATSSRLRSGSVSAEAGWSRLAPSPSWSRIAGAAARASATPADRSRAPTITLSSTLRPANGRTIWKVRAIPAAQTWSGRRPSIRRPAKRISPASGAKTPATMLNVVVLPAPFGPIRPTMAPSATSNETPVTARRPRKDLETSRTSRCATALLPPLEAEPPRDRRPDPVREEHHDREEHDTVEHLLDAGDLDAHRREQLGDRIGEDRQHRRAENRPEQGADAADDRPEDDLDRPADVEDLLGEEIVVIEGEEDARHRGHRRADHHREHLPAEGVDAERLGRRLIFPDRLPVVAGPAAEQPRAERERARGEREHEVVEHRRRAAQVEEIEVLALRDLDEQATRPAEPVDVVEADPRELGERDREQREVHTRDPETEREEADRRAERHAQRNREPDPGPGPDPVVEEEARRGIRADPHVQGVAERELPGEPHHHVPRLAGVREEEDESRDREDVARHHRRQH